MQAHTDRRLSRLRVIAALGLLALGTASAASADILVAVESPQNQTAAPQPFIIKGWALDTAATANPGIAEVQVWAYPNPGSGEPGFSVGTATYGGSRPQVGQERGAQFTNSGYQLTVRGLAPKTYLFAVFARSSISNTWGVSPATVTLQVQATQATPIMYTSTPNPLVVSHVEQPFTLGGFAIDFASVTGSGVAGVYVVAYPTTGAPLIDVGPATYGIPVPEVGTFFGEARFAASGFQISVSVLPPGQYDLVSFAYSTVAAAFNNASVVRVNVDTPVPAPVISLPTGTYPTPQSVTIEIPAEAAVHITRDGTTPTLTSESYPGGVLTVSENTSLRARAFRAGWLPSPTVAAEYTIVGAAPTILTAGGQYETPVTVQISVPAGATVRITRDGSTPTSSSEEYGAPFEIAENTQLRALAFKAGMAPSATVAADYTFSAATPTFSLAAGTYPDAISVALTSATPGASLHWTTDGSDPTTSSNAYVTPISIPAGVTRTLKARAFRATWTPSPVAAATYVTSGGLTGPVTISAQISPAPNSAGWNNSDVTVTFTCTNANVCPSPTILTQETATQTVSGTASNSDHESTTSVVVKIDRTPPVLSSVSPADGSTIQSATVTVSASVLDALSGLSTTRCNGAVTTANPSLACVVPLSFGRNTVTLSAMDAAGNGGSVGIRVLRTGTRTRLLISPSHRTLPIGQKLSLFAFDEYGQVVSTVAWTSGDPAVGTVTPDTGRFTALSAGQTTVTASEAGLSAEMTVTVVTTSFGDPLPPGTTEWSLAPSPDSTVIKVLPARRLGNESPDLFVLEHAANGSSSIRGVTSDGTQLWVDAVPIDLSASQSVFADAFGGVVATVMFGNAGSAPGLVRVAGPSTALPWRYESSATLVASPAQAPDGTIYLYEATLHDGTYDAAVVAIDGSNGRARFRVPLPNGVGGDPIQSTPPRGGAVTIASDGTAYAQVAHSNEILTPERRQGDDYLELLTIQSDGTTSWRPLDHFAWDVPRNEGRGGLMPGPVIADGLGGVLLSWTSVANNSFTTSPVVRLIDGEESRPPPAQGLDSPLLVMSGEDGTVLRPHTTQDFVQRVIAFDAVSGATKWTTATEGWPLAVLPDGAALVYNSGTLALSHIDAAGQIVATQTLGLIDPLQTHDDAFVGATASGTIAKVTTASFADRTFAPSQSGQRGVNLPQIYTFAPEANYHATPTPFTSTDLVNRVRAAISPMNATAFMRTVSEARFEPFISAIGSIFVDSPAFISVMKQRATVVGVIAHSIDIRETTPAVRDFSVGVKLFDFDLIKKRPGPDQWVNLKRCQSNPPNLLLDSPECLEYARPFARWVDKIYTHAKVIVLATCFVGQEILSLFDLTDTPEDQVLIVPENPNLTADLLYAARFGWPTIANELSLGRTVRQAIDKANECLPLSDPNNTPDNEADDVWTPDNTFRGPCSLNRITWRRIGGTDGMRIRPIVR